MIAIKASDHIQNGFSEQDAHTIFAAVTGALAENDAVEISFAGVKFYTTLFFSLALTRFLADWTKEEYEDKIKIKGLSRVGRETYKHALDYAVDFYKLSKTERAQRDKLMRETMEEA
jgi:hypothetical protein